MVDETKGPADASSIPPRQPDTSAAPEPIILEEHVVAKKAPAQKPDPAQGPASAPQTPLPSPAPVQKPPTTPLKTDLSQALTQPPQEPAPSPQPDIQVRPAPKPPTPIVPDPARPAAQPQAPQQKAEPAIKPSGELQADIANILGSVKLPERRGETASTPVQAKKTYDTSLGAMLDETTPVAPVPAASAAPTQKPQQPASTTAPSATTAPKEKYAGLVVPLHTLKDDLQHVVRDQKISVVRAASLEEERRHRTNQDEAFKPLPTTGSAQRGKRTLSVLFSVVLLLGLGAAALGGVYYVAQKRNGPTPTPQVQSLIFAESTVALQLGTQSPSDIKNAVGQARAGAGGTLGSITRIMPTITSADGGGARPATFSEFMKAIGSGAPDDLLRATADDFFFGIHTVDKNAPLIVVPVTSYDRAFAAMLAWEPTMNSGLSPIFTPVPAQTTDQNGLPAARNFQDIIMRNYDARALKDDSGNVQLYYSFPTQHILIIAESPYSFAEVLSRLQAERRL